MSMPAPTTNDDSLKNSLISSAAVHLVAALFLYFGLPHLMPPLSVPHPPVPFEIVELADMTNTRVKDPEPQTKPPEPEPPKPQPKPEQAVAPTPPPPPKPEPPQPMQAKPAEEAEALKAAAVPKPKPKPPEAKPQADEFNKLLKNLENNKKPEAPKVADTKPDAKTSTQPATSQASSLSNRLSISAEDALRRQVSNCWNINPGARDAQNLIVEVIIDVNPDRTARAAEIVDKSRYASDSFFRAAADAAVRAVLRNPKCSPLELPADEYEKWKRIDFTFDPRDIL
jgi:outer membrane biosynthesis protein TonB